MREIFIARQVGQEVRDARKKSGLTQAELAERAHVSARLVSGLELGDNTGVGLDKLLSVFHALGLVMAVFDSSATGKTAKPEPSNESDGVPRPQEKTQEESRDADSIARMHDRYQAALALMRAEATNDGGGGYGNKKP